MITGVKETISIWKGVPKEDKRENKRSLLGRRKGQ